MTAAIVFVATAWNCTAPRNGAPVVHMFANLRYAPKAISTVNESEFLTVTWAGECFRISTRFGVERIDRDRQILDAVVDSNSQFLIRTPRELVTGALGKGSSKILAKLPLEKSLLGDQDLFLNREDGILALRVGEQVYLYRRHGEGRTTPRYAPFGSVKINRMILHIALPDRGISILAVITSDDDSRQWLEMYHLSSSGGHKVFAAMLSNEVVSTMSFSPHGKFLCVGQRSGRIIRFHGDGEGLVRSTTCVGTDPVAVIDDHGKTLVIAWKSEAELSIISPEGEVRTYPSKALVDPPKLIAILSDHRACFADRPGRIGLVSW